MNRKKLPEIPSYKEPDIHVAFEDLIISYFGDYPFIYFDITKEGIGVAVSIDRLEEIIEVLNDIRNMAINRNFRSGYIKSIRDDRAIAVITTELGDRQISFSREDLEPLDLYRKGAHFSVTTEYVGGKKQFVIQATPEEDDNKYREEAMAFDMSFFDKKGKK